MFNVELYKESLRKTKILGSLFIVGMLLGAVVQPIAEISNYVTAVAEGWRSSDSVIHVWGIRASLMMLLAPITGAPFITLSMFSFLNKRHSSDFYHAIPHKRETLFGSFIAGVFTWVVGGMWLATATSVMIYVISPYPTMIHWGSIFLAAFAVSAAILLAVAATILAMTVTGTRLSNVITTALILYLPRLFMTVIVGIVVDMTGVVSSANFGILGNPHFNLMIGLFNRDLGPWNQHQVYSLGTMYTLILGLLYLIIAGILFKKRPSELAENSASKLIQPMIRVGLTFAITLLASWRLIYKDHEFALVVYLIGAFVYFLYEFLVTKTMPKLIQMIPGLGVVVTLNVLVIIGIHGSFNAILQEVNVASISSVTIVDLNVQSWRMTTYGDLALQEIEITDPQVIKLLGETLNENIKRIRQGNELHGAQWEAYSGVAILSSRTEVRVTLNMTDGRRITRNIRIRSMSQLTKFLGEYLPYQEVFMRMPEHPEQFFNRSQEALTQAQLRHVYEVLREEVAEVDFSDWFEAIHYWENGSRWSETIEVMGRNYSSTFPLTELTPRALERYQSYIEAAR